MSQLAKYLWIAFISMVPLIELRGAIPVSQAMGLPLVPSYAVCIIANMVPVPCVYLFAHKLLVWAKDKPAWGSFANFVLDKGERGGQKLMKMCLAPAPTRARSLQASLSWAFARVSSQFC